MTVDLLRADSHLPLRAIDHRIRHALAAAAVAAGPKAQGLMAAALADGPSSGGAEEASRWFGESLPEVIDALSPMIIALNNGMPGFSEWLDRTGYGNDLTMMRALLAWMESDPETAGIVARLRHKVEALN